MHTKSSAVIATVVVLVVVLLARQGKAISAKLLHVRKVSGGFVKV